MQSESSIRNSKRSADTHEDQDAQATAFRRIAFVGQRNKSFHIEREVPEQTED